MEPFQQPGQQPAFQAPSSPDDPSANPAPAQPSSLGLADDRGFMDVGDPALAALASLVDQGVDPMDVLAQLAAADELPDTGTRPGVPVPGEANSLEIKLSEDDRQKLSDELCDLVEEAFLAKEEKREREGEIRDAYAQKFNPLQGGSQADSASLASEMMTSFVDQAAARLITNFMAAKPVITVEVTEGSGISGPEADQLAGDAEGFINAYSMDEMDFKHLMPIALLRGAKVGTAVFYLGWEEEQRVHFQYSKDSSKPKRISKTVGHVAPKLLDNDNVLIWPPTLINWQRGYQLVGHRDFLTPAQWRATAAKYGLSEEVADEIENDAPEKDASFTDEMDRQGVNSAQMLEQKSIKPTELTELWCDMVLPGGKVSERFQVILHRGRRKILWIGHNGYHSQQHPYYPLRYKWGDNSAWGSGIGDEILNNYLADTALWCLELDNLYAGAYWAILRRAGSIYNTQSDNPRPGMVIAVDDVDKDFKPIKLGGGVPEIGETRMANQSRAASGSGLSSVMFGQGDPVQKSGTGTGATNALIEQGNKKLAGIDLNLRTDVSAIYEATLQLVAQFAQDGIFYRRVDEDAANRLRQLLYIPPRGEISQMFQFRAQAPSVTSTNEARSQGYMLIWNFAMNQTKQVDQYVTEMLQANNPSAIPRWKQAVVEYLNEISRKVIEFQEMPGITDFIPQIPEMLEGDEQINGLTQQLQQAQQQLQQAQEDLQKAQKAAVTKPPSEAINFKDVPPEAQVQMLRQVGITITPPAAQQSMDPYGTQPPAMGQDGGQGGNPFVS